ncbi:MAG: DNA cytosine methyltransferase [Microthrixaceae bacterium]
MVARIGDTCVELPKVVSLFSGAGGLDLGFSDVNFPVVLAVDSSQAAIRTHQRNFPSAKSIAADLVDLGPEGVIDHLLGLIDPGERLGVIGGPPCQGFSRANTTGSGEDDPRNKLPILYLDIVEALQSKFEVEFVLFENVLGIRDAKHSETFAGILDRFRKLGLRPEVDTYSSLDFGVPQKRTRVIISGFKNQHRASMFRPKKVPQKNLTVRDAIGGLPPPAYFTRHLEAADIPFHPNHWTMQPRSKRFSDPHGLHAAGRSFRRLSWDAPSPTVAYGHREIHVHPDGQRRLSIYEAMILQGFPEDFVLEGTLSSQVEQVSNAVPPPLARALAVAVKDVLSESLPPAVMNG